MSEESLNKTENLNLEILTERLKLIPVKPEHVSALVRLWTNSQVRQHLGGSLSLEQAEKKAVEYIGKDNYFAICAKENENLLGVCSLDYYRTGDIEVSYELLPEAWGKGYGSEAVKAAIDYGFSTLGVNRMIAVTQSSNEKSRALLEKLGMTAKEEFEEFGEKQTMYEIKI